MTNRLRILTFVSLVCSATVSFTHAQVKSMDEQSTLIKSSVSRHKLSTSSPEERIVRLVYEKLSNLNSASVKRNTHKDLDGSQDSVLKFQLSNFEVGPIQNILSKTGDDLVSRPTGEIVQLTRVISSLNSDNPSVSYKAEWTNGQYASLYDPQWSIAQLLSFEPDKNHDVGEYVSYHVELSLLGKSKSYKALALFHNPYQFQGKLVPSFWDTTVGLGGTLTDIWDENRPISMYDPDMLPISTGQTANNDYSGNWGSIIDGSAEALNESWDSLNNSTSSSSLVRRTVQDSKEHVTGAHGQTVGMQGTCFDEPNNQQRCQVDITDTFTFENGELTNLLFFHSNKVDEKTQTATGSRGTQISCYTARGVATGNCSFLGCRFSATLQGSGTNIQMVGGDVWNGQLVLSHTCNIPSLAGGSCTTPSFDGSCPPGSSPNGSGLCCFSTNSCGSLTFINKCYMYGGDYDFLSCTCSGCDACGGSPIVIDLNGDGIVLTGPSAGVDFDLNGNGTRDRLAWTTPNSDDAWLALDRNGNGNIDNGTELFGDYTLQPAGPNKNGFLALAEFDKPSNGGNSDGIIDKQDRVFSELRLWQDTNHNGIAETQELHLLLSMKVTALELDFKESKRIDEYGNEFRYRARLRSNAPIGRWAWDVFLAH